MAGDRSAQAREAEWLEEGRRAAVEGWSYDRSALRPGAAPRLVWHEYRLASVWTVAVTGLHDSERGVAVFCGGVPMALGTDRRTVADALEFAARYIEDAARSADREHPGVEDRATGRSGSTLAKTWREHAQRLRERAQGADVKALALAYDGSEGPAQAATRPNPTIAPPDL